MSTTELPEPWLALIPHLPLQRATVLPLTSVEYQVIAVSLYRWISSNHCIVYYLVGLTSVQVNWGFPAVNIVSAESNLSIFQFKSSVDKIGQSRRPQSRSVSSDTSMRTVHVNKKWFWDQLNSRSHLFLINFVIELSVHLFSSCLRVDVQR